MSPAEAFELPQNVWKFRNKALAFLKIQESKTHLKMKVCLEMQSICLRFAGIEKSELFIPPERVIIHLKAPHLWNVVCGQWQLQRGEEERWTDRQACVQKQSLLFSDWASLITNTLRWRRCEEPLGWSWCLTQEKKDIFEQEGLKWPDSSCRDTICSKKMSHRLKCFLQISPGEKWLWFWNF